MIMVICAVKVNNIESPSPQATNAEEGVASVKTKADKKVIIESMITNINASG